MADKPVDGRCWRVELDRCLQAGVADLSKGLTLDSYKMGTCGHVSKVIYKINRAPRFVTGKRWIGVCISVNGDVLSEVYGRSMRIVRRAGKHVIGHHFVNVAVCPVRPVRFVKITGKIESEGFHEDPVTETTYLSSRMERILKRLGEQGAQSVKDYMQSWDAQVSESLFAGQGYPAHPPRLGVVNRTIDKETPDATE